MRTSPFAVRPSELVENSFSTSNLKRDLPLTGNLNIYFIRATHPGLSDRKYRNFRLDKACKRYGCLALMSPCIFKWSDQLAGYLRLLKHSASKGYFVCRAGVGAFNPLF